MAKLDFIPPVNSLEYDNLLKKAADNPVDFDFFHENLVWELGDVREIAVENEFSDPEWFDDQKTLPLLVEYMRSNDNLWLMAKYILNVDLLPYQLAILKKFWHKPFVLLVAARGASKSFLLAVYSILRLMLHQGCKICVVGASLRQSLVLFNYIMQVWNGAPILRDICKNNAPRRDPNMAYWFVGESKISFLPLGDGETIRGQRANIILCDETASVDPIVFETVVRGFASVRSEGVWDNVQQAYITKLLHTTRSDIAAMDIADEKIPNQLDSNQIIMAGSACPEFNHFYSKYYTYYRDIIETRGRADLLREKHPDREIKNDLDYKDYCIIHLPHDVLPVGLMDEKILSQGRTTMDPAIFMMEYGACFVKDTNGFIPASTIHRATCPLNMVGDEVSFKVSLIGEANDVHVMGIDPASEDDNFTVSIVALRKGRRCIVYQWATNRKDFDKIRAEGLLREDITDYLTFCILHIRNLMRRFNPVMIGLDSGGGGLAVKEALKDKTKFIDENDKFILDMDDESAAELPGDPILKLIEFSDYAWRREAHWGIKTDIGGCSLLFPEYDHADGVTQQYQAVGMGRYLDTLEDAYYEIEQCKQECIRIKAEQTTTGLEKWDVPNAQTFTPDGKKVKLKKDRFTSLMIANWIGRVVAKNNNLELENAAFQPFVGGTLNGYQPPELPANQPLYCGRGATRMYNMQSNGRYWTNKRLSM